MGDVVYLPFCNREVDLPDPPEQVHELTLEVTLLDTEPPVWRRFVVAGDTTLDRLHAVLQTVLGWTDSHLHRFHVGTDERAPYFVTAFDVDEGDRGTEETTVRVDQVLVEPGDTVRYLYDFGDGWSHDVRLVAVGAPTGEPVPRCTDGARACPPEDVGGTGGYADVVAWHDAGRTEGALPGVFSSLEHIHAWLPQGWAPDAFDAALVTDALQAGVRAAGLVDELRPDLADVVRRLDGADQHEVLALLGRVDRGDLTPAALAEVTRPFRVLLGIVGEGVKLTAAGYLPPRVVSELFEGLDLGARWIGKGNREDMTWPVLELRQDAQQLGLLRKAKGVLSPTAAARRIGDDDAALWRHLAGRLPRGQRQVEEEAGLFALLALAAGVPVDEVGVPVAHLLASRRWRTEDGMMPSRWVALELADPTLRVVLGPRHSGREEHRAGWTARAAADVLFDPPGPSAG